VWRNGVSLGELESLYRARFDHFAGVAAAITGDQPFDESFAPAANGHGAGDELGVRAFLSALPQRQRAAVFLRYHADLDYRRIAEILEVEVGTVSATLSAAHTVLRKTLGKAAR
jgi:DNA-directed RNA polymerase specialized sigma24 family protein